MKRFFVISLLFIILLSVLIGNISFAKEDPVLFFQGQMRQGELLFGFVTPGSELTVNDERIAIRPDGWFAFGIGRDDTGVLTFKATKRGKTTTSSYNIAPRQWDIQRVDGLPQNTVTPSKTGQKRIADEAAITAQARQKKVDMSLPLCFSLPAEGTITGVFGSQRIMNNVPGNYHNAVDIANKEGTPIIAPADGIVLLAYEDMLLSGKTLLIGHGQDVVSSYIHMNEISVKEGQKVKKGQEIGKIGMTGRATGPHLHWGISWKNKRTDPMAFLENSKKFCPVSQNEKTSEKERGGL